MPRKQPRKVIPTPFRFLALPNELKLSILRRLDYKALLTCARVCRLLRELVAKSDELQYIIELAVAGYENGAQALSFAERRARLRAHREAWRYVRWTNETTFQVGSDTGYCTVHDGVLASHTEYQGRTLVFRQIASQSKGIAGRTWEVTVQPKIHSFAVDMSQDLLMIVEKSGSRQYRIHLLRLSDGLPHPNASIPILYHERHGTDEEHLTLTMNICDEFLGVLFSKSAYEHLGPELLVWNWYTGAVELFIQCYHTEWSSFSFLTRHKIVVPTIVYQQPAEDRHCLMVINFQTHPSIRTAFEDVQFDCTFDLPEVYPGRGVLTFDVQAGSSPTWTPPTSMVAPFHTARNHRLLVCTLMATVGDEIEFLLLFVPSSVLLTHLSTLAVTRPHIKCQRLPWETWGPEGTRMRRAPECHSSSPYSTRVRFVSGLTYVAPFHNDGSGSGVRARARANAVQVLDFNPVAIRRAVSRGQKRADDDGYAIVTRPTVVKLQGLFKTGFIRTSLPYRWKCKDMPREFSSVNVTEDALVVHHGAFVATDSPTDGAVADEYSILSF